MRFFATYIVFIPLAIAHRRYETLQAAPGDLMPRFFIDRSYPLAKRAGDCGSGNHNCLEVGFPDDCCDNDSYCYVNQKGDPKCCPIGSNCSSDSPCNSTAYFCTRTATASGTTTEQQGCCDRKCPKTSLYLCPSNLGGTAAVTTLNAALVVLAPQRDLLRERIYSPLYLQDAQRPSIVAQSERDVATTTKYARKLVARDTVPKLRPQKAVPQSSTTTMMVITS
ncbi:hypothetical protein NXS19_003789 [Fusarium pseudograminearum]|nr:hypothetical protein NXS19_003789 [Fusarium pseudograminearum]